VRCTAGPQAYRHAPRPFEGMIFKDMIFKGTTFDGTTFKGMAFNA
jgi:hypothetical protein